MNNIYRYTYTEKLRPSSSGVGLFLVQVFDLNSTLIKITTVTKAPILLDFVLVLHSALSPEKSIILWRFILFIIIVLYFLYLHICLYLCQYFNYYSELYVCRMSQVAVTQLDTFKLMSFYTRLLDKSPNYKLLFILLSYLFM